jgi:hypothetical protein
MIFQTNVTFDYITNGLFDLINWSKKQYTFIYVALGYVGYV